MEKEVNINHSNYEEYIVNYLDGNISPLETAELFLFLEQNPALNEDIEELRNMRATADESAVFGFNEVLKHNYDADALEINQDNYLYYFTAALEGDLTEKGQKHVNEFVAQHPALQRDYELMQQCRLPVDEAIVFSGKESLKKKPLFVISRRNWIVSIAASILILITLFIRMEPQTIESASERAGGYEIPVMPDLKVTDENQAEVPAETENPVIKNEEATSVVKVKGQVNAVSKDRAPGSDTEIAPLPALSPIHQVQAPVNNAAPFDVNMRNTYSSLYQDIRLSQELMLAYAENVRYEDNTRKSPVNVGRRFGHILQSSTQVASQVSGSLNGWAVADLGIKGFNALTDNELKLVREVDASGKTGDVRLEDEEKTYSLRRAPL